MVYFVIVVPYKKLKERDAKVEEEDTELTLLTEIRDLLADERQRRRASMALQRPLGADEARKSDKS